MKSLHSPRHWIAVALVLAVALLTFPNVYGQRADGSATFQARPALAGAQAGHGAAAGPPQGGLGLQGTEGAERPIGQQQQQPGTVQPVGAEAPPPPNIVDTDGPKPGPQKKDDSVRDQDKGVAPKKDSGVEPKKDRSIEPKKDSGLSPKKDSGVAKEERSATGKAKRASKGTADRARHGVSPIDMAADGIHLGLRSLM